MNRNRRIDQLFYFLSGVFATVIGVLIKNSFDNIKIKKLKQERYNKDIGLLSSLIDENKKIINDNKDHLKEELDLLNDLNKKYFIVPLLPLKSINNYLIEEDIYLKYKEEIMEISLTIERINYLIMNRENFKINEKALLNFSGILIRYDKILLDLFNGLNKKIKEFRLEAPKEEKKTKIKKIKEFFKLFFSSP